jgi:hypothetical protein
MTLIKKTNYTTHVDISDSKTIAKLTPVIDPTRSPPTKAQALYRPNFVLNRGLTLRGSPYDFTETYRVLDTESFVSSTFRKKRTLILKDGFQFISENERDASYIKKRLEEFHYVTDVSFKELLEQILISLVNNHNAFILPIRKESASTGNVRKIMGKTKQPIAGFYVLPETKIELIEDEYGLVIGYKYLVSKGIIKYYDADEIIHLKMEAKPGYNLGTPPLEPLIDDIIALRQIEESLERLIYKLSVPIIHAKVGTEAKPAGIDRLTGEKEVDQLNRALLHLEDAGGITTSERVEFKMLGAESQALRLSGYLEYFKNRVLVGLSISDLDLGVANSTSSGSAVVVTKALQQNVEMYQRKVEDFISDVILPMILLESDAYKERLYLEDSEKVLFRVLQSNIDDKIKVESHYMNEFNAGLLTADEYRVKTGKRPLTSAEKKEIYDFKNPPKEATTTTTSTPSSNTTKNVTAPANQHSNDSKSVTRTKQGNNSGSQPSPIRDDLNLNRYIANIEDQRTAAASTLLGSKLRTVLTDAGLTFDTEEVGMFVDKLTSSLQNYIIGTATTDSALNIVERLLCKKILEIVEENDEQH